VLKPKFHQMGVINSTLKFTKTSSITQPNTYIVMMKWIYINLHCRHKTASSGHKNKKFLSYTSIGKNKTNKLQFRCYIYIYMKDSLCH